MPIAKPVLKVRNADFNSLLVDWQSVAGLKYKLSIKDAAGSTSQHPNVLAPFTVSGLSSLQTYELVLDAHSATESASSDPLTAWTTAPAPMVAPLLYSWVRGQSIIAQWDLVAEAAAFATNLSVMVEIGRILGGLFKSLSTVQLKAVFEDLLAPPGTSTYALRFVWDDPINPGTSLHSPIGPVAIGFREYRSFQESANAGRPGATGIAAAAGPGQLVTMISSDGDFGDGDFGGDGGDEGGGEGSDDGGDDGGDEDEGSEGDEGADEGGTGSAPDNDQAVDGQGVELTNDFVMENRSTGYERVGDYTRDVEQRGEGDWYATGDFEYDPVDPKSKDADAGRGNQGEDQGEHESDGESDSTEGDTGPSDPQQGGGSGSSGGNSVDSGDANDQDSGNHPGHGDGSNNEDPPASPGTPSPPSPSPPAHGTPAPPGNAPPSNTPSIPDYLNPLLPEQVQGLHNGFSGLGFLDALMNGFGGSSLVGSNATCSSGDPAFNGPFVIDNPGQYNHDLAIGGPQCVSLLQELTNRNGNPIGPTQNWRSLGRAIDNPNLRPGTAIATMVGGRYPQVGRHAGIFNGFIHRGGSIVGFQIVEQHVNDPPDYKNGKDRVHIVDLMIGGGREPTRSAENYHVIGTPRSPRDSRRATARPGRSRSNSSSWQFW